MRLIDADALKVSITRYCAKHIEHQKWRRLKEHTSELCRDICFAIEAAPTVEERKRGKWTEKHHAYNDEDPVIEEWQSCCCSVCGRYDTRPYSYYFSDPNYCSYCGAKMEKSNG